VVGDKFSRALTEEFIEHVRTQYFVLEVTPEVIDEAVRLIENICAVMTLFNLAFNFATPHRQQLGLPPLIFVSADEDLLLAAAQAEGFSDRKPELEALLTGREAKGDANWRFR
jgi:hypothetical protein